MALAYGIPERVAHLNGYGNAIVPQVGAEFVKAFLEAEQEMQK
jgi:DNA (cytosine-5)-methyltransferase 1